jgi:hypothetical protein
MKDVRRSPAEAGTTGETAIKEKVATEAGVSIKKGAVNRKVEAKGPTCLLADPPPHHLVEEVEAEAEAGDLVQNPPAAARVSQGNVSTNTDLNTLAQNALVG